MRNTIFALLGLLISHQVSFAQTQFTLSGSAIATGDSCFTLTPDLGGQVGSIWSTDKVSLNQSFEIYADIFLGHKDNNGADGMTFSLQPVSNTTGSPGGGLGMEGVSPSLFIEFDTWQNANYNDPVYDHIAMLSDGVIDHSAPTNLAGPVSMLPGFVNAEDSAFHLIQIKWNAPSQTLTLSMDCIERLSYTGDIINSIFSGDDEVFWGFTASTGGSSNEQKFCFRYISFDDIEEITICKGDTVQLNTIPGTWFNWRPYAGLTDPSIQNPVATPDSSTLYHVKYIDVCGESRFDTILVHVRRPYFETDTSVICEGDSVQIGNTFFQNKGTYIYDTTYTYDGCDSIVHQTRIEILRNPPILGFDTAFCPPNPVLLWAWDSTYSFKWNTGATTINILVNDTGTYWVDMTKNGCTTRSYFFLTRMEVCEALIQPANVFTPNGDGQNDVFPIFTDGIVDFQMEVFNRWGNLVFKTNDLTQGWDGTSNGANLSEGVYFYQITYKSTFEPDQPQILRGSITLLR